MITNIRLMLIARKIKKLEKKICEMNHRVKFLHDPFYELAELHQLEEDHERLQDKLWKLGYTYIPYTSIMEKSNV